MMLPSTDVFNHLLDDQFERRKFTRRDDLTSQIRLEIAGIALNAQMMGMWGVITSLANQYNISRTFVYSLCNTLTEGGLFLFDETSKKITSSLQNRELAIAMMLSLRLECRSSTGPISTVMNRFEFKPNSVGSISQTLTRIGALLPMTISMEDGIQYLVFASDEIFSKTIPILVTVDPISSVILRIELADSRKAEDWRKHFECLRDNGIEAIYMVSDDGQGLRAGHADALSATVRQSDTYHAVAHKLGSWVGRLEKVAYKAITEEHDCEKKLSAKSDRKRKADLDLAADAAEKAVLLYDNFSYLYRCILEQLDIFDRNGNLRDRQTAEEQIESCLTLIEELEHDNISDAVGKIRRAIPDLFHYLDIATGIIKECREIPIDEAALKVYCLAWQYGKAVRKAKKTGRKKWASEQEQFYLEYAKSLHPQEEIDVQEEVYSKLDGIVQSSAMVECINSIIRPYLNASKNHITQEQLNLIMYYHNHRRYRDGVRKGKTPMEILTGEEQTEDWVEKMLGIIREKDPELLFAS